jgi:hypothetical protein
MRTQTGGERVWQETKNMWGHTPQALWDDNHNEGRIDLLTCVSRYVRVAIVYAGRVQSGALFGVVMCEFG